MIICLGTTPTIQRTMIFNRVVIDDVNRTANVREYASGKSINCARVIQSLGEQALCMGYAGAGRGKMLLDQLTAINLHPQFVSVPAETRLCTTVIDQSNNTATELIEESLPVSVDAEKQLLSLLESQIKSAKALVLSGSLTPQATEDFYARCAAIAGQVPVIIDAKGVPLSLALTQKPTIIKPNRKELAETSQIATDDMPGLLRAIDWAHERGAANVLVTDGAKGACASNGINRWWINSPKIDVISAIGSGDSVTAGVTVGYVSQQTFIDACKLGIACGAANAMTALAGQVIPSDVKKLLGTIVATPL